MREQRQTSRVTVLSGTLQKLLDRAVAEEPRVHGGVLLAETPSFRCKVASGRADRGEKVSMSVDDPFHVASITKMFTAATVLSLAECGEVSLDVGLGRYLAGWDLSRLHVVGGHSYGAEITLRQVLGHTSGLPDFFSDGEPSADGFSPFLGLLLRERDRLWDSRSILQWTEASLSAHFPPGSAWRYCDTGYLLAGLVVEAVTGSQLHEVMGARIFEPLQMQHTYMAFRQRPIPGLKGRKPSVAYVGDLEYSEMRSASADWAGGGLVTTAEDLNRFIRGFAGGQVHGGRGSGEQMLAWNPTGEKGVYYGLGVRRFVAEELGVPDVGEVWGHTGFVKSFMLYCPELEASICGTLNQSEAGGVWSALRPVAAIVPSVLAELKRAAV